MENDYQRRKKKLTQVFEEYITSNYLRMFKKIKKPSFKLIDEKKIGNDYKLIKTYLIINDNENVEINYLLLKTKMDGEFLMFFLQVLSVKLQQKNQNLVNI